MALRMVRTPAQNDYHASEAHHGNGIAGTEEAVGVVQAAQHGRLVRDGLSSEVTHN